MDQPADASTRQSVSAGGSVPRIAFQGQRGAYSHLACRQVCPGYEALPAESFEDAFAAVREGHAERAMIPIENSIAGRVADIHHLMPHGGLHIIGEHFLRVNHHLLAVPGAQLEGIKAVHSHVHALNQCRRLLRELAIIPRIHADTAGAAAEVAEAGRTDQAAIASRLAADIYGLEILRSDIEDAEHNTTRFVILAREAREPPPYEGPVITSFLFRVRNVPAALYKALGGFATNGVNMVKLESYVDAGFNQAQFYAEVIGHPEQPPVRNALEELAFFSHEVERLGVYPAHPFRFRNT
jgi:prephenate dehydratase